MEGTFENNIIQLKHSLEFAAKCLFKYWILTNPGDFNPELQTYDLDPSEVFELSEEDEYFKHVRFVNWRFFILEIAKFYKDSRKERTGEKGSFRKLLIKLKNKNYPCKTSIDEKAFVLLNEKFSAFNPESESQYEILKLVSSLRNKHFAHRDDYFYAIKQEPFYHQDAELILLKAVNFVNSIIDMTSDHNIEKLCIEKYRKPKHLGLKHLRSILLNKRLK